MLKYRKNLVSILVSYNITIQEILDKLKKFFERNVENVLETLTYKFLKYFDNNFVKLTGNLRATSEIGT